MSLIVCASYANLRGLASEASEIRSQTIDPYGILNGALRAGLNSQREETVMKCGHCKDRHDTVQEVRACYGIVASFDPGEVYTGVHLIPVAPKQVKTATKRYDDIPEGRYAVKSLTGNNDLDFFKVDKPTEGKWQGYTFVNRVIGGRPDVPVKGATKFRALEAIKAAGPDQAKALFGQTLGYCGECGRHLTDEESRAIGIGPVCRAS